MSRFKRNSVKEALDNLPSGVCFFDRNGVLTLCNYQMYRLFFALTGRDLQSLTEMQEVLNADSESCRKEKDIFLLDDGSAWRFTQECVTTEDSKTYTQFTASNVTELYRRQKELERDKLELAEYAKRMRRLSADIITLIREEESLNMKMRIHDDIGRSVIATRQFLQQNRPMKELDLTVWKKAVRLLKHDNELREEQDAIAGLMSAAYGIGIKIIIDGELPESNAVSDVIIAAIRECMTNAVRHAGAKELYVNLTCDGNRAVAVISNDGAVPEGKIVEGGGLASLRVRIRNCGGTMLIESSPKFALTVSVPIV